MDDPLLFMHIPKTAGMSLRWLAEQQYPGLDILYPGHGPQLDALAARGGPAEAVIGHFRFGLHERLPARRGRYVTFLRDPIDQVVSHFNYLAGTDDPENRGVLGPADGLLDFLAHPWARNLQTQFVCGWSAERVNENPVGAVTRAADNLARHFVGVGLVERFAESVSRLAAGLRWRVPAVPRLNAAPPGRRTIRRADLDPAVVRAVEAATHCDRLLYEHARLLFDAYRPAGRLRRLGGRVLGAVAEGWAARPGGVVPPSRRGYARAVGLA